MSVCVLGAGAMGTAMALQLARAGQTVALLATPLDTSVAGILRGGGPHPALGVPLPTTIEVLGPEAWPDALERAELVVVAVATAGVRPTVEAGREHTTDAVWVVATKGWDPEQLRPAAEVVAGLVGDPRRVVALGGPCIAEELARGAATGLVAACPDLETARRVASALTSDSVRVYVTDDVVGVEVGAAVKNVVAIAVGIAEAEAATANTRALVFTRGLLEMAELARALGGRPETLLGLAGAGDLFVTCLRGRNAHFGRLIGGGVPPERALVEMGTTVEGYVNAPTVRRLTAQLGLDLPLLAAVHAILYEDAPPRPTLERVLMGPPAVELT